MGLVGGGLTHQLLRVEVKTENAFFVVFNRNLPFCLATALGSKHWTTNLGVLCCSTAWVSRTEWVLLNDLNCVLVWKGREVFDLK